MAYNHQQVPFWDFIRGFEQNGAGVDHPAVGNPAEGVNSYGPPPPEGEGRHGPPPHPFGAGFPFGGQGFWGQGPPEHGGRGGWGGWGPRGGRRGRHGRHHRDDNDSDNKEHEHTPTGSRSPSPNKEHAEGEAREGSPNGRRGRHGHHGHHGPHAHGHHGRGGFGGWGGRGGWGAWGGRGGCGQGWGGRGGFGERGQQRGFGGPDAQGGFDLSGLFESLSAHPLAQAFRTYAEAQRSGETLVPEDAENNFTPPVDIFSTEKAFVLHVALPGAKKEDVGVSWDAEKGLLNLAGVVYRQGDEEFLKTLSKSERKVGVFERTLKLPPGNEEKEEVDGDAITAKLEDGVLVVTVPKIEKEWLEIKKVDIV